MLIDPLRGAPALRSMKGEVKEKRVPSRPRFIFSGRRSRLTSEGHCFMFHVHTSWADMALLTEGENRLSWQL
jgi:hypothetical protein